MAGISTHNSTGNLNDINKWKADWHSPPNPIENMVGCKNSWTIATFRRSPVDRRDGLETRRDKVQLTMIFLTFDEDCVEPELHYHDWMCGFLIEGLERGTL